jgi:hypothetical protein
MKKSFPVFISGDTIPIQEGDFLFQKAECGPLCDAIEEVTAGYHNLKFSHIGLVLKKAGTFFVIEAISKGVSITPLPEFLHRSLDSLGHPLIAVGRLKPAYHSLVKPAITYALEYLGKPYNVSFNFNSDTYYCSQLIYLAFLKANMGQPFFKLQPMTFKSPITHDFYPGWIDYFKSLNLPIPEGELGINPGGISLSPKLDIIYLHFPSNDFQNLESNTLLFRSLPEFTYTIAKDQLINTLFQ